MSSPDSTAELRPVQGPSAIGGGARRFFDLLWLISVTDFKKAYFGTVLGYVWSLMRPLLTFAVLLFVFTRIVRFGSIANYPVLLLLNIVLITFFQEATQLGVSSVVAQEGIVRKTQFPRLVIPLSVTITASFTTLLNLIPVFIFMLAYGVEPTWTWLLLPVLLLALFVLIAAIAMIVSVLYVRFRDVAMIWAVMLQILFYATPVIYALEKGSFGSETEHALMQLNPLTPIFEQTRRWIIDPTAESALSIAGSWWPLLASAAIYLGICGFAVWIFNHDAPRIAEEL